LQTNSQHRRFRVDIKNRVASSAQTFDIFLLVGANKMLGRVNSRARTYVRTLHETLSF